MTDSEILTLIRDDPELSALAKAGDDEGLAKRLSASLPRVAGNTPLRPGDFLRLFGWSRGLEIVESLPPTLVAILGEESLPLDDEAIDYVAKAASLTADEESQLGEMGLTQQVVTADDVARILRGVREGGKVDPTKPIEVVAVEGVIPHA